MEPAKFRETLRRSTEATSRDMLSISEKAIQKEQDSEDYFNYEAHYKSHLYHTLLSNGVSYEDLHPEWRPSKQKVAGNHIDLWYLDPEREYNFLIEVKQVYGMNRAGDDIRGTDYIVRYTNSKEIKSGIIKDVIKLSDSCGIREEYHGVMLVFWADPKVRENLDLDAVRNSVIEQVRRERPRARTTRVELLWSSSRATEYRQLS